MVVDTFLYLNMRIEETAIHLENTKLEIERAYDITLNNSINYLLDEKIDCTKLLDDEFKSRNLTWNVDVQNEIKIYKEVLDKILKLNLKRMGDHLFNISQERKN